VAPRRPHARRLAAKRRRRAYPQHTREEIVFCMLRGHSVRDTQAALLHEGTALAGLYRAPSQATCYRIRRRFKLTGLTTVKPRRGKMTSLCADEIRALRAWCEKPGGKRRGYRLSRLVAWFDVRWNRVVHKGTVCRWLRRLGLTRKKGSCTALQQDPEQIAAFWERCQRCNLDPHLTVWFDECGFDFRDFRLHYGYSPRGERFYTRERLGRGMRINALASMSAQGLFAVDFYHNGSITYDVFEEHILRAVAPKMLRLGMEDLVMDNAKIHHANRDKIVHILKQAGIRVHWLAPYWPQGNPIENLFGWVKSAMKDLRETLEASDVRTVCRLVGRLFDRAGGDGRAYRWTRRCGYFD
jgi:transposase